MSLSYIGPYSIPVRVGKQIFAVAVPNLIIMVV